MTTAPVMTITEELLAELRAFTLEHDSGRAGVLRGQIDALLGKDGEACADTTGKPPAA